MPSKNASLVLYLECLRFQELFPGNKLQETGFHHKRTEADRIIKLAQ